VFHGLNGVWMIASDYIKKDWLKVLVFSLLLCLAGILLTLGLLTVIPFKA
jgi:succinate dehydrogenase hydrophobic anchor subunit